MEQTQTQITVETRGKGMLEVTDKVTGWVAEQGITTGMLTIFIRHTSASLVVQENADSTVLEDFERYFSETVPEQWSRYRHKVEGPDDMPAHIRSALTATSLNIPVVDGVLALGTWQGIFLYEHRAKHHTRSIVLHLIGE